MKLKFNPENILNFLICRDIDYTDIFVEDLKKTAVSFEDSKVEKVVSGIDAGTGIRIIKNENSYYAYSNNHEEKNLLNIAALLKEASNSSKIRKPKKVTLIKEKAKPFKIRKNPLKIGVEEKIKLIKKADKTARKISDRIKQVRILYSDTVQDVVIGNMDSRLRSDKRVHTVFSILVIAEKEGIIQTGYETIGGFRGMEIFDIETVEEASYKAASKALMMLSARKAPSGRMPVVISSEAGGTMIHEAVGHGLEGDLVSEGLSVYAGKAGEMVASELVTVVDDATIPYKRGSFGFDDEGNPAQRTVLIERGILRGFMQNYLSAKKMKVRQTGNGRRESYRCHPVVRMTNTLIVPGKDSPDKILKSTSTGLFVTKMGGGQVDTITGNFVFEVSEGYLIENGSKGEPVRGATLTGNGPQVLKDIDMVGSDLGFAIGTCGKDGQGVPVSDAMPTIRIKSLIVGGEKES